MNRRKTPTTGPARRTPKAFCHQGSRHMHLIQFREIMQDAEVAYAIHPIARKYLLTVKETTKALFACGVPRAANVAQITSAWI
jgi:hypothetical protein